MNIAIDQAQIEAVNVTPSAKQKIAELLSGADEAQQAVRVFVAGGGCGWNELRNDLRGGGYRPRPDDAG